MSDTNLPLKVLIVEDEIKVIEAVKAYFEKDGFEINFALLGNTAIQYFNENKYDIIILDLMLPDMTGEEICKIIRKTSDVPIIMLTAKSSEDAKINGLNIGADDYLIKPFSPRELLARVKAILRRTIQEKSNKTTNFDGGLSIDYDIPAVYKNDVEITLTPNEFKILSFLIKNIGKYFSREQLIENAIGPTFDGYDRAIDSHIKNIRQKIEDNPKSPKYIVTQYGFGYKFNGTKK